MKKNKNTLLWRISSSARHECSYVFGTMHVKDERAFGGLDLVFEKIDNCDAFAAEFNLAEAEMSVRSDALDLPNDKTLRDFISEKKYNKLRKVCSDYFDFDVDMLQSALPLVIVNALSAQILMKDREFSLDEYLWRYASGQEKITMGIETYTEQLEILHKIPLDYQFKALFDITKNVTKFRARHQQLAALYTEANIHELYRSTRKSLGKMRGLMLYHRNKIMAKRIARIAEEQSLFAAIGAAHLSGKQGVLRLLKEEGYSIKPIQTNSI